MNPKVPLIFGYSPYTLNPKPYTRISASVQLQAVRLEAQLGEAWVNVGALIIRIGFLYGFLNFSRVPLRVP